MSQEKLATNSVLSSVLNIIKQLLNKTATKTELQSTKEELISSLDKDWNENDTTSTKYIANRTHYGEIKEKEIETESTESKIYGPLSLTQLHFGYISGSDWQQAYTNFKNFSSNTTEYQRDKEFIESLNLQDKVGKTIQFLDSNSTTAISVTVGSVNFQDAKDNTCTGYFITNLDNSKITIANTNSYILNYACGIPSLEEFNDNDTDKKELIYVAKGVYAHDGDTKTTDYYFIIINQTEYKFIGNESGITFTAAADETITITTTEKYLDGKELNHLYIEGAGDGIGYDYIDDDNTTQTHKIPSKYLDVKEYTAGDNITISDDNIISATVPDGVGQVYPDSNNGEIFNDYTNNKASGDMSHSEGSNTTASGINSHAEGYNTTASSNYSHAEGEETTASNEASHAEGYKAIASGQYSHAEGYNSRAQSSYSHAEGYYTFAMNQGAHAEGEGSQAIGADSHASGLYTIAASSYSTAIGKYNVDDRNSGTTNLFIVGNGTASDKRKNALALDSSGNLTLSGTSITLSGGTIISSSTLNKIGQLYSGSTNGEIFNDYTNNKASGKYSHAEGYKATASGDYSHAECSAEASGKYSHAEGVSSKASSDYTHAEGGSTVASSWYAHAEGVSTTASGYASHSEGYNTVASGYTTHAAGTGTVAYTDNSTAIGKYNISDQTSSKSNLFIVGNGTDDSTRANALELDSTGNLTISGTSLTLKGADGNTYALSVNSSGALEITQVS